MYCARPAKHSYEFKADLRQAPWNVPRKLHYCCFEYLRYRTTGVLVNRRAFAERTASSVSCSPLCFGGGEGVEKEKKLWFNFDVYVLCVARRLLCPINYYRNYFHVEAFMMLFRNKWNERNIFDYLSRSASSLFASAAAFLLLRSHLEIASRTEI